MQAQKRIIAINPQLTKELHEFVAHTMKYSVNIYGRGSLYIEIA